MNSEEKWVQGVAFYAKPYILAGMDIKEAIIKAHQDCEAHWAELYQRRTDASENFRKVASDRIYAAIKESIKKKGGNKDNGNL